MANRKDKLFNLYAQCRHLRQSTGDLAQETLHKTPINAQLTDMEWKLCDLETKFEFMLKEYGEDE